MTLKSYLFIMTLATILCWASFVIVINVINPETTNWLGMFLFYLSLFLSLAGTISIIGFLARFGFLKHEMAHQSVRAAFRQAFLISIFIIISLLLLSYNLLTSLNVLFLTIGLSVIEYFLLSYNSEEENNKLVEQNYDFSENNDSSNIK